MPSRKLAATAFALSVAMAAFPQGATDALRPGLLLHPHGNFSNNVARPLRYQPVGGAFFTSNGPEFFNRPLYCANSGFRIDGGDKPEFSLYLPGRGGNLRLGIKSPKGMKWLNDAQQIITSYNDGSLTYAATDPLLDDRILLLTVVPLSQTKGVIIRFGLSSKSGDVPGLPLKIVFACGGASGTRGARGGDIGCERQPVSEFFQLRPEECRGNIFSITNNTFVLRHNQTVIAGITPAGTKLSVADATKWNSLESLLASAGIDRSSRRKEAPSKVRGNEFEPPHVGSYKVQGENLEFPVIVGEFDAPASHGCLALQVLLDGPNTDSIIYKTNDLSKAFLVADERCDMIAQQVSVTTPDPFINAAVPALCVAADAIWDEQQQCYMHGAVAWRTRLLGWRGPYAGDDLGWHGRTAAHFASFAKQQNTNPVPETIPPPDEQFNLARSEAAIHSNGDLSHNHYDMNLLAVDAFFRHLLWTGDTNYACEMWPVIERHFAWERRLFRREFGPDKLPLYEGYAAIWASDDLNYNGAGTAHASACNYFANMMAARVAKILGKDPVPYQNEADLILRAMNKYLWLPNEGNFAESKDLLGLQLVHPNSGLWTFYHTLDSKVPSPMQAWQMTHWIDTHIAHIPITGHGVPDENLFVLPETSWLPYQWSLNNVVMAENAHTALGFWQANRPDEAFALFKGELLDSMFLGLCPGNLGCMTSHDMARGEAQRDFGDAIGANSRALVEGLFGIHPDALAGNLTITPGFPASWPRASIVHPDVEFEYAHWAGTSANADEYDIEQKFPRLMQVTLQIVARGTPAEVTVNDKSASWNWMTNLYGVQRIEIAGPAQGFTRIIVHWKGAPLPDRVPAESTHEPATLGRGGDSLSPQNSWDVGTGRPHPLHESFDWNARVSPDAKFETVVLTPFFNDQVTQIFRNDYRSPRSPYASLATPMHGIGGWCEPDASFDVDDSGLLGVAAKNSGKIILPDGIPLATPSETGMKNIIFTSQWDNYPHEVTVPLDGKSSHAFLLMAGSTGPMQSQFDNGEIVVTYADGSTAKLPLRNPTNWWPIDQDYFTDDFAFRRDGPFPPRVDLATAKIRILDAERFKGQGGKIPGGAATVLEMPLDKRKPLKSLTVRALANEVVIGLMSVTLQR